MVFVALSIIILLYGCIDFKKGLMLCVLYRIFSYSANVVNISSFSLNSTLLLCLGYSFLYLLQRRKLKTARIALPFCLPFVLSILSYIFTCFFALAGFGRELSRCITLITQESIFIWLLWDTIESKNDFKFLFKGTTIIIFLGGLYGLFEYATNSNPLLDYKYILSAGTLDLYNSSGVRGLRMTSIFEHPIGGGMTFGLYAAFVITLWIKRNEDLPMPNFSLLTALLSIVCVLLTKSRSTIVFLLLASLAFIDLSSIKRKRFFYGLIGCIIAIPFLYGFLGDDIGIVINNLFAVDTSSAGGSSLSMRLNQLTGVIYIFKMSPLFGLGEMFRSYIASSAYTEAALGYESVWFEQAVKHGIFGLFTTVISIYYTVFKVPRQYHSREIRMISIAYWVVRTITAIPSYRSFLMYLVFFYFIKSSDAYKNYSGEGNLTPRIRFTLGRR